MDAARSRAVVWVVSVAIIAELTGFPRLPVVIVRPEVGLLSPGEPVTAVCRGSMLTDTTHEWHQPEHPHRILDEVVPRLHLLNEI